MAYRKPELIPVLFIIAAIGICLALGIWQVQRLQWKNAMLADIEKAQAMPTLGTLPQDLDGLQYRHVKLTGVFDHYKVLRMIGHPHARHQGFYVITPFTLEDDGRIILVNRGWSPKGQESKPEGVQTIEGIIRPLREKRLFSPDNKPAKNIWFYEDIPAMSMATELTLTPLMVEITGTVEKGAFPIPGNGKITVRNDHLNYAITWFALAIIAAVMFVIYHREPKKPA